MSFIPYPQPLIVSGAPFTRPADTNTYAFGDLVANSVTAGSVVAPSTGNIARAVDQPGTILRARLFTSGTSLTLAIFRLHLYNQVPTPSNGDNNAWLTNIAGYQGCMDLTVDKAFTDGANGIGGPQIGYGQSFVPVSGAQNLFYLIEARGAYTPTSGETFTPVFEIQ